jgi:TonB-linked SusC/RagA family outer membrane protein
MRCITLTSAALVLLGWQSPLASPLAAQGGGGSPTESVRLVADAATLVPQLHRSISLRLAGVSVEAALREIGRRADVPITYNDAILPRTTPVWLTRDEIRTDEALELVLRAAGLRVMALSTGQLVVVKVPAADEKAQPAAPPVISGRVTEAVTGLPIPDVRVAVVGTNLGTATNTEGRYTIRGAPVGVIEVRVMRVGFQEQKKSVATVADQTATLDFVMTQAVLQLADVVTTATGEQRRVELGNAVANIGVTNVAESQTVRNISDVLNSRVPGVSVQTGMQTGVGSRIRIRGSNSVSLNNAPIYIIDGVRMTSQVSFAYGIGGAQPARSDDLSPDDIENIEIVKGPSAATLYGTDASNGVVLITTKKGKAGAPKWAAYGEGGFLVDRANNYPTNATLQGHTPSGVPLMTQGACVLPMIPAGTCIPDSLQTTNLWKDWHCTEVFATNTKTCQHDLGLTMLGTGYRNHYGGQLSGGTDVSRFFISADREGETGVFQLPRFEQQRYDSIGVAPHEWTSHPNVLAKNSFRLNINSAVNPKFDIGVNMGYINSSTRLINQSSSSSAAGIAFYGQGYLNNGNVGLVATPTPLMGYGSFTPSYVFQEKRQQDIDRFIGSVNIQWRPTSWLQNRANIGSDVTGQQDIDFKFRGEGPPTNTTALQGLSSNARTNLRNLTADFGSTATFTPTRYPWLNLKTTGGMQYVNVNSDGNLASASNVPPGTQTVGSGTLSATSSATQSRTLGFFVEQAVALRDRLFLTAAIRTDQNSAFGTNFQHVAYPKISASWILSDESFFPRPSWLSSLRLRTAYGASGVQPGATAALSSLATVTGNVNGVDVSGLRVGSIDNPNLKPERSSELEGGFESTLFGGRATIDVTRYYKRTKDALIAAVVPPSLGSASTLTRNLGAVRNDGWEGSIMAQVIDRRSVGFDFTLSASINRNMVLSLGNTPTQTSNDTRIAVGYPIGGYWEIPLTGWNDKNHDGILVYNKDPNLSEVSFAGDTSAYMGVSIPPQQIAFTPAIELLHRKLRIQTMFDYRGGDRAINLTDIVMCNVVFNCVGRNDPHASLFEQARALEYTDPSPIAAGGDTGPGNFIKWREISAVYTLPDRWAHFAAATGATVTFTARNIQTWTKYTGVDPENSIFTTGGSGDAHTFDQVAVGPPTYYVMRINLRY